MEIIRSNHSGYKNIFQVQGKRKYSVRKISAEKLRRKYFRRISEEISIFLKMTSFSAHFSGNSVPFRQFLTLILNFDELFRRKFLSLNTFIFNVI